MPAQPTMSQVVSAQRRIHSNLDQGKAPAPVDVEIIGGQEALETLLSSRSELKEVIKQMAAPEIAQAQEEQSQKEANQASQPGGASTSGTGPETEKQKQPHKMTPAERDYHEFVSSRLGPLMCLIIFLVVHDWDRAAFYAFSPDECNKMAGPLSKLGPRIEKLFHAPAWVHTVVTTSDDTVTLLFVFASYFERIGILDKIMPVFSEKRRETVKKYAEPIKHTGPIQQQEPANNGYQAGYQNISALPVGIQWSAD